MDNFQVTTLFPTVIETSDLGRELTEEEKSILLNAETRENTGNLTSKNSYILDMPEMANLKDDFSSAVQHYMDNIICAPEHIRAYITQSWVNYTGQNQYHHKHSHRNSYLSAVFYIDVVEDIDKIVFHRKNESMFDVEPKEWNFYNSESWWYPAKNNSLIIFPSELYHSVNTKDDSNIRISLSFNTFLKGRIGDNFRLTELIL